MPTVKSKKSNLLLIAFSILACLLLLTACESDEVKSAKEELNTEISRVQNDMDLLQAEINTADAIINSGEKALDENTFSDLQNALTEAKTIEFTVPETPSGLDEINAEIANLKSIDYAANIQTLKDAEQVANDSIAQMKLVTNPSEAFVIKRLKGVKGVGKIAPVTEKNDPNGHLNKARGYTAAVYFSSPMVNQSEVSGNSVIDKGTDGGGCVEVYLNEDDANNRNDQFGMFDGGMFASGSHKVVGTVIVRTSNELTASQQKKLENRIIKALTKLEK